MHVEITFPQGVQGCTCGPYWSVVPPPPCPHHSFHVGNARIAGLPCKPIEMNAKDLAALYRRLADALDPPTTLNSNDTTTP